MNTRKQKIGLDIVMDYMKVVCKHFYMEMFVSMANAKWCEKWCQYTVLNTKNHSRKAVGPTGQELLFWQTINR